MLDMAARLLTRDEREAILGDLTEAGASARQGVLEILGVVIRREAALWYDWRPWLAACGVALPGTLLLLGVSFWVSCTYQRLTTATVCALCSASAQEGFLLLLCQVLLLIAWSWTGGFVVGSISRRTLWVSAVFALCPCICCLVRFRETSLSRLCVLLFIPPAILGIRQGLGRVSIKPGCAFAVAAMITALTLCAWMNNAFWILNWVLIGPAWYIAWSGGKTWLRSSG
jgi:hypothetical protein